LIKKKGKINLSARWCSLVLIFLPFLDELANFLTTLAADFAVEFFAVSLGSPKPSFPSGFFNSHLSPLFFQRFTSIKNVQKSA
jgi:hypothetical protein